MVRQRRPFTPEFKLQMVHLFENGKSKSDIDREYDLTPSALDKWIKYHQNSGSFNAADNLSNDEKELRKLRKENQLNHTFNREQPLEALVSDLTCVKVADTWHYICLFTVLFNREIDNYCAGKNKDANLVVKAIRKFNHNL